MPCHFSPKNQSDGFSLAELLAIVVIMGVLSSIAIVGYGNVVRRERLNNVALSVAGWIEQVRNQSANEVYPLSSTSGSLILDGGCEIEFKNVVSGGPGTTIAQVLKNSDGLPGCPGVTSETLAVPAEQGISVSVKSSVLTSATNQKINFTPRGMILADPSLVSGSSFEYRIILADGKGGPKRCVRISDITGTVDIGYGLDANLNSACSSYSGL